MFFYFFESRGDPDKDDVLLWTNGGEQERDEASAVSNRGSLTIRVLM